MSLNAENSSESNAVWKNVVTKLLQKLQAIEMGPITQQI